MYYSWSGVPDYDQIPDYQLGLQQCRTVSWWTRRWNSFDRILLCDPKPCASSEQGI